MCERKECFCVLQSPGEQSLLIWKTVIDVRQKELESPTLELTHVHTDVITPVQSPQLPNKKITTVVVQLVQLSRKL